MSYVYGKIKNIKIDSQSVSFKVESDWKIIDYNNKNKILNLYCYEKKDNASEENKNIFNKQYFHYDEKNVTFRLNVNSIYLIINQNKQYKIIFDGEITKEITTKVIKALKIMDD